MADRTAIDSGEQAPPKQSDAPATQSTGGGLAPGVLRRKVQARLSRKSDVIQRSPQAAGIDGKPTTVKKVDRIPLKGLASNGGGKAIVLKPDNLRFGFSNPVEVLL